MSKFTLTTTAVVSQIEINMTSNPLISIEQSCLSKMIELRQALLDTMSVYDDAGGRLFKSRHNLFDLMISLNNPLDVDKQSFQSVRERQCWLVLSMERYGVGSTDTARLMTIPKNVSPEQRNQLIVAKKQIHQLISELSELKKTLGNQLANIQAMK